MTADPPTVLIVGATSDIARALAHAYARTGAHLQLAARESERLAEDAADLELRYGVRVRRYDVDVLARTGFGGFVERLDPLPDTVVCAVGLMADAETARHDLALQESVIATNFTGPVGLLSIFADRFVERGHGTIIGIGSVAGDRGRAVNYVYGAAKAGFAAFLSGLRQRLNGSGVRVVTVKPGFVETRMTAGMDLPRWLTKSPFALAERVVRAERKGREVVYSDLKWRIIMLVIRVLPEGIFKRLSF